MFLYNEYEPGREGTAIHLEQVQGFVLQPVTDVLPGGRRCGHGDGITSMRLLVSGTRGHQMRGADPHFTAYLPPSVTVGQVAMALDLLKSRPARSMNEVEFAGFLAGCK